MRFFFIILLMSASMFGMEQDSVKKRIPKLDLEALSPDSFSVETDVMVSSGWFPHPGSFRSIELIGSDGLVFHPGIFHGTMPISGSLFGVPNLMFQNTTHHSVDDRIPLQSFSTEESDEEMLEEEYAYRALRARFSIPELHSIMRIGLGIRNATGMYFSEVKSPYLNSQGSLSDMLELHAVSIIETSLIGNVSIELPIYGVYLETFGQQTYSHYSVFGGVNVGYVLDSDLKHQSFILQGKDEIRYASGSNVATLQSRPFINEVNRLRMSFESGLGWQFGFGPLHLGFEGYVAIPITSMVKRQDLTLTFIGIRGIFGLSF
ncbi:MAG: hypothetical protein ACK5F4_02245 [Ignavibacteria bacterium]